MQTSVERAKDLVHAGDFAAAAALLREHLGRHPDDAQAWHRLAGALIGASDFGPAAEAAERSLALDDTSAAAYRMLALARNFGKDPEAAYEAAMRAIALNAADVEALTVAADAARLTGRKREARALLDRAIERDPAHPAVRTLSRALPPRLTGRNIVGLVSLVFMIAVVVACGASMI